MSNISLAARSMPLKYMRNDNGDFICPCCPNLVIPSNKQSTMHYHLKRHELEKTTKETSYECKACKKKFLQKQNLDLHIKSRHPELLKTETAKKFKCPFDDCEFTSLTKGNCIVHCLRVHFNEEIKEIMVNNSETKTIECCECCEEFNSSSAFYYHCKDCLPFNKNDEKYNIFKELLA